MSKFTTWLGGVVGGWALLETPLDGSFLSGIDPVVDFVGVVSMVVFSGALIYNAVREFFQR
jgi:hypothetical protein